MQRIVRRISVLLVGLGLLGGIVPVVWADETADSMAEQRRQNDEYHRQWREWREAQDRADQQAQAERDAADRAYQQAQQEQAARDKAYYEQQQERAAQEKADYEAQQQRAAEEKAQADREAMDKYRREWQATWDEQAAWHKWQEEQRQWYENERRQKEWDDWMNNSWGHWPTAEPEPTTTATQIPAASLRARSAARSSAVVILNPFALETMKPEEQERVRQEATQTGLPIQDQPQGFRRKIIQNPFVRSRPSAAGR